MNEAPIPNPGQPPEHARLGGQKSPMKTRAMFPAVLASIALHAGAALLWNGTDPAPQTEPTLTFSTQIEAVLVAEAYDPGETPLPSQAADASSAVSEDVAELKRENQRLMAQAESLQAQLTLAKAENQTNRSTSNQQIADLADSHQRLVEKSTNLALEKEALETVLDNTEERQRESIMREAYLDKSVRQLQAQQDQAQAENTLLALTTQKLKNQVSALETGSEALKLTVTTLEGTVVEMTLAHHNAATENLALRQEKDTLAQVLSKERLAKKQLGKKSAQHLRQQREDLAKHRERWSQERIDLSQRVAHAELQGITLRGKNDSLSKTNGVLANQLTELRHSETALQNQTALLHRNLEQLREAREQALKAKHEMSRRVEDQKKETAALKIELEKALNKAQPSIAALDTGNTLSRSEPIPVAGNPKPVYPRLAVRQGLEGNVSLAVNVSASGKVSRVTVSKPSGSRLLDEAAVMAVRQWRFTPAVFDGIPSPVTITKDVQFRLLEARG